MYSICLITTRFMWSRYILCFFIKGIPRTLTCVRYKVLLRMLKNCPFSHICFGMVPKIITNTLTRTMKVPSMLYMEEHVILFSAIIGSCYDHRFSQKLRTADYNTSSPKRIWFNLITYRCYLCVLRCWYRVVVSLGLIISAYSVLNTKYTALGGHVLDPNRHSGLTT